MTTEDKKLEEAVDAIFEEETKEVAVVEPIKTESVKDQSMKLTDTQSTSMMNPDEWMQMKAMSQTFFDSKALPEAYKNVQQVMMAVQAGKEMGLQPMEAINGLLIVNGQISAWGKTITKLLRRNGWKLSFDDKDDECTLTATRGDESFTETVKFSDAIKSGYTTGRDGKLKFGWKEGMNRRLKLRYMAMNFMLKTNLANEMGPVNGLAEIDADVYQKADVNEQKEALRAKLLEANDEN